MLLVVRSKAQARSAHGWEAKAGSAFHWRWRFVTFQSWKTNTSCEWAKARSGRPRAATQTWRPSEGRQAWRTGQTWSSTPKDR